MTSNPKIIRFNKCPPVTRTFQDDALPFDKKLYLGGVKKGVYPLVPTDYNPLKPEKATIMKQETNADSVVIDDDYQLKEYGGLDIARHFAKDPLTGATIKPLYPPDGMEFWKELDKVVTAQILRVHAEENGTLVLKNGTDEASMLNRWPDLWYDRAMSMLNPWGENMPAKGLTLPLVAKSVAGEFSNYHQQTLLKMFASENVQLAKDIGAPFRSETDFIGMAVRMGAINAWSLEAVGPVNFFLKWNYGVPRPEEVAWQIHSGVFTAADEVPEGLKKKIDDLYSNMKKIDGDKKDRQNAVGFTAYPTGSPTHPSFPAMHSAGSTCSLWIPLIYDLTADQYAETILIDYAVAFARTIAGVHYDQDNLAGLNAGQRIIREKIPEFLREHYGYDEALVRKKVRKLSFDWNHVTIEQDRIIIKRDGKTYTHDLFLQEAVDSVAPAPQSAGAYE